MDTSLPPTPQNASPVETNDPAVRESLAAGHETTDVNVKGLFIFGGSLVMFLGVTLVGVLVLLYGFKFFNRSLEARRAAQEPGAASLVHVRPDYRGPLLQVDPEEDLHWMQTHNAADLRGYGWVDRPAGIVRLPVERAMDLIAEHGLPPLSPGQTMEQLQRQRADPQVYGQSLHP